MKLRGGFWYDFLIGSIVLTASLTGFGCNSASIPASNSGGTSPQPQPATRSLLVADSFNSRVLVYVAPFSTAQSASIVLGQSDFVSSNHGTSAATLSLPDKAISDAAGNIWVTDTFNSRVLQYKQPLSNGMAASVVLGQPDFATASIHSPTQNGLLDPVGMAFDGNGNLWVADGNRRVVEFSPPFTTGMPATLVLGQPNFLTVTSSASASGLAFPTELAFDSAGNLWVVDQGNNRVLEYKPPFVTGQSASVVIGQPDFTSSGSATTAISLNGPYGIAFDATGNLWVSDFHNNRVLKFTPPFANGQAASLVLGQPNFTTNGISGDNQVDIAGPYGLVFDTTGNLFVDEVSWNRVVLFAPPFTIQMEASIVIGQPNFNSIFSSTTASGLAGAMSVSTSL